MEIVKYDVVSLNLNPKKGHVQAWIRPCIVIQNNLFNRYAPTIIVVALTTNASKLFPSEFLIQPSKTNWLSLESRFLGSQILTVDKEYIVEKLGTLEEKYHEQVKTAIWIALDNNDDY